MQQQSLAQENDNHAQNLPGANAGRPQVALVDYEDPDYDSYHQLDESGHGNPAAVEDHQQRDINEEAGDPQPMIAEYAKATAEYFHSKGLPYPAEPSAPRYDTNMVPFFPQLVDGELVRLKPLGQVDRLPPVQREASGQADETVNRAPSTYLSSGYDEQGRVMQEYTKTMFDEVTQEDFDDKCHEMTKSLRITQALRSELTTTSCGHIKPLKQGSLGKKQIFALQHNQNCVDTTLTQFQTYKDAKAMLNTFVDQLATDNTDVFVSSAMNAMAVVEAHSSNAQIIQDEYKLADFNGQLPAKCVKEQFYEMEGFQPDHYFNGVKQHSTIDEKKQDRWCQSGIQGDTDTRPSTTISMLNGMISGVTSKRRHLLQNIQSQGSFVVSLILQQSDNVPKLGWLQKALMPQSGLNLLTLLAYDLAGSHTIGRNDSNADFGRKISQAGGFLRVFPLLITNKDDEVMLDLAEKSKLKKAQRNKQSTREVTETEQSAQGDESVQRSRLESSAQDVNTSIFTGHLKSLKQMLTSIDKKAENMKKLQRTAKAGETLKNQLYGHQEIWRSNKGELVIVDSLVKLGTRRKDEKTVLFCELSTCHQQKSKPRSEAMASPSTLDTQYYDCDENSILNERENTKMWKQQESGNKFKKAETDTADQKAFVDYCNRFDVTTNARPLLRLAKTLRDNPVYSRSNMSLVNDFTLIRIQNFTVAVHEPLTTGDALIRQANLVLSNSEVNRHLMMFKSEKTVKKAQAIIAHVSDFEQQQRNPLVLTGSKEKIQDLNKNYYLLIQQMQPSQVQRQSPVHSPIYGQRSRRQRQQNPSPLQEAQRESSSSIQEVVQLGLQTLRDFSTIDKCILVDLWQRNNLLESPALALLQSHFYAAYQLGQANPLESLPYHLFRPASEINADPQGVLRLYNEHWCLKPLPLLLSPQQFTVMVELLQNEGSDLVYRSDQKIEFFLQQDNIQTQEVLLKGLARALIVYLQMFQTVEERHLRTHIMVGDLIQNFAFGVLGIVPNFDIKFALRQHETSIEKFVAGIFKMRLEDRPFTRENVAGFREYYREQIIRAARQAELAYHQSKEKNIEARRRAEAAAALHSPTLDHYRLSSTPSVVGNLHQLNLPVHQADHRLSDLNSPMAHNRLFTNQPLDSTPQLTMNSVPMQMRVTMQHPVDPQLLISRLQELDQQTPQNYLNSISPAQYTTQTNLLSTPAIAALSGQTVQGQPPVQAPQLRASEQPQLIRKSQRQESNAQSANKTNSAATVPPLMQSIARLTETSDAQTTGTRSARHLVEETKEEVKSSNLGKRGHALKEPKPRQDSSDKKRRDNKKHKK